MTAAVHASAPGKLVLLGEYAVLLGHPAAVMAVDRRASVELDPAPATRWSVRAPGFAEETAEFRIDAGGGLRWLSDAGNTFELVESVVSGMIAGSRLDPGSSGADIVLDTRAFFDGGAKLGLGSSAALTVALFEALARWCGADSPTDLVARTNRLLELHRRVQGGRGSGIDLAASLAGGVVEYRLNADGGVAVVEPIALPSGLRIVTVWTGRSVSTSAFLERLEAEMNGGTGAVADAVAELGGLAAAGIRELRTANLPAFLDRIDAFAEAMQALGDTAGLDIFSDAHRRLCTIGHETGVRVKPSGAGGGDMALAFTDDPDAAARFADRAAAAGFTPLDLTPDPVGSTVENGQS